MIIQEVRKITHSYARKGGKKNRHQQVQRMLKFAEFCASEGANSLGQVGSRHVINYWRSNRDLSDSTLYNHWLAIRTLWELAGKAKEPPPPFISQ